MRSDPPDLWSEIEDIWNKTSNISKVKALLASKGLRRVITLRTRHDIWNAAFVNDSWVGTYSRP